MRVRGEAFASNDVPAVDYEKKKKKQYFKIFKDLNCIL